MYDHYRLIRDINVSHDDMTEERAYVDEIFTYFGKIGNYHMLCNYRGQTSQWAQWTFDKYLVPVIPNYSNMWEDICLDIC